MSTVELLLFNTFFKNKLLLAPTDELLMNTYGKRAANWTLEM